jgi:citrate lyase subunit beta/citryl-CoA lyase
MLGKAGGRGADALVIDLEDSVAEANKPLALETVQTWLSTRPEIPDQLWIRLNEGDLGCEEAKSLSGYATLLSGFVIAKVRSAEHLEELLDHLPIRSAIVLIETSSAIRHLDSIASTEGVQRLMLGEEDLGAEIAVKEDTAWDALRIDVVVASAAAGLPAPIGPVDTEFSALDSVLSRSEKLERLGFGGQGIIHPAQIEPVHTAFAPTVEAIESAQRIVSEHAASASAGIGAYVDSHGRMADNATVARARILLDRWELAPDQVDGAGSVPA